MSSSSAMELHVNASQRVQFYQTDGSIKHLIIDGTVFVQDLLATYSRSRTLEATLSTAKSLTLLHLTRCRSYFNDYVDMEFFFHAMVDMRAAKRISITQFTLPNSDYPPYTPACITTYGRIRVPELVVNDTHGPSLSFFLTCFDLQGLYLGGCSSIEDLPDCDRLTLGRIPPQLEGFLDILAGWEGPELIIDSCAFLDEDFVRELTRIMVDTEERIWPRAKVLFFGCSYAVRRRLYELQDLRSQL